MKTDTYSQGSLYVNDQAVAGKDLLGMVLGGTFSEATKTPTPIVTNTPTSVVTNSPTNNQQCTLCDIDNNGSITPGDALTIFQIYLGQITPTAQQLCAADCDGSGGNPTPGDALCAFMKYLGRTC